MSGRGGRAVAVGQGVSDDVGQTVEVAVGQEVRDGNGGAVRVGNSVAVGALLAVVVPVGGADVAAGCRAVNVGSGVAVGRSDVGQNGRATTVRLRPSSR